MRRARRVRRGPALPLTWRLARSSVARALPVDDRSRAPAALALGTADIGAGAGLAIAFAFDTRAFAPWWAGLGAAHRVRAIVRLRATAPAKANEDTRRR